LPLFRFGKLMREQGNGGAVDPKRLKFVTVPCCVGLLATVFFLPWPMQVSAPAFVQYENPTIIRVEAPGFVEEICLNNGELVNCGDILVKLSNRELLARLTDLEAERQRSLVRSRRHHADRAIAAYQSEVANRLAIEKQIDEMSRQLESLILRAPVSGIVRGRELESSLGQFVSIGTELLQIVDEGEKEIIVSVGQDDFDDFSARQGQATLFASSQALARYPCRLGIIEPTASSTVDSRLTSLAGGPLAVRPVSRESAGKPSGLELVQPRFRGVVSLKPDASEQLHDGSTGRVCLNCYPDRFAIHVVKKVRKWIRSLFEAADRNTQIAKM
jgi:hypothetical protein